MVFFLAEMVMLSQANDIPPDSKKGKFHIVNSQGRLVSLLAQSISVTPQNQAYPLASKRPESKQLYSTAAIGTRRALDYCKR